MKYRYLFGPVPSRRFGRSLGIDLAGGRRCSFDCVFCEVGKTDCLTLQRQEYVPTSAVIGEFQAWLAEDGVADVITLAGSGEPTLHSGFGAIIDAVHTACTIPVALLTNSSLLTDPDVRASAARADIVKVSLGAWDEGSFEALNHPVPGLSFSVVMQGLRLFRVQYRGHLRVEVMLVRGVNDVPWQVERIAALAAELQPATVQLNTVVRPPAFTDARPLDDVSLERLAGLFTPKAEVIAPHRGPEGQRRHDEHVEHLACLQRDRVVISPDI